MWMAGVAGAMALMPVASAFGATQHVVVGGGSEKLGTEFNSFYPRQMSVHVGDKVVYQFRGFHTATVLPPGGKLPGLIGPGSAKNVAANDPAGVAYWWGGVTPQLTFNGAAFAPTRSNVANGRRLVNSGVPGGKSPKFTIVFGRKGSYTVRCIVHPNMRQRVVVKDDDASVSTHTGIEARSAAQVKADTATAKAQLKRRGTANQILVGVGTANTAYFGFLPKAKTVAAGTPVTFSMAGRNEVHTVTFGPTPFLTNLSKAFEGSDPVINPEAAFPSDPPPAGPPAVTATSHGNGFANSGVMFDPGTPGTPKSFTVTFPTAGTYSYICLIHTNMKGTITVSP